MTETGLRTKIMVCSGLFGYWLFQIPVPVDKKPDSGILIIAGTEKLFDGMSPENSFLDLHNIGVNILYLVIM